MARVYGAKDSSLHLDYDYDSSSDDNFESSLAGSVGSLNLHDQSPKSTENSTGQSQDLVTVKSPSTLYNWSFQVLAEYTSRNLTFSSEKFVAISSLAKELNTTFFNGTGVEDTYVAGMWLGTLAESLLWTPLSPADVQRDSPKTDRAQSWSSRKWDVPCIPTSDAWRIPRTETLVMDHVGHTVELATSNKYECIKNATLTVRGHAPERASARPYWTRFGAGRY
jgi:hypothetical protein